MKTFSFFRWLLFPFAFLYGWIGFFRNKLYDWKILKSTRCEVFTIGVGNLSTGGTGKTPHVEYLLNLWKSQYAMATISRGYKRKTKGFVLAKEGVRASNIGDEPMQLYRKFPNIAVAVGEKRVAAVRALLEEKPSIQVIVLDDVFQHRAIQVDVQILLTDFHHLFTKDYVLPMGNLREFRSGYKRADIIIISKCPNDLSDRQKGEIIGGIRPLPHQKVLFSYLRYHQAYSFFDRKVTLEWEKVEEVLVVCGIAKPERLVEYVEEMLSGSRSSFGKFLNSNEFSSFHQRDSYRMTDGRNRVHTLFFGDHHDFSIADLEEIKGRYDAIPSNDKALITTEKDVVRLEPYADWLEETGMEVYCLPVEVVLEEKDRELLQAFLKQ